MAFFFEAFYFVKFFSELYSSRTIDQCILSHQSIGLIESVKISVFGVYKNSPFNLVFGFFGFILILFFGFKNNVKKLTIIYLFFAILLIFGFPSVLCSIPVVSGIRIYRHLIPYTQALFFILVLTISINLKIKKFYKFILPAVILYTSLNRIWINAMALSGKLSPELGFPALPPPKDDIFYKLIQLSQNEDRRHFSNDKFLYPNFSSAIGVLDTRLLQAFYPKSSYISFIAFPGIWETGAHFGKLPDRFVGFISEKLTTEGAKFLINNRVSLVTTRIDSNFLNSNTVYNEKSCQLIASDDIKKMTLWKCGFIDGVGFFPKKVVRVDDDNQFLSLVANLTEQELIDNVYTSYRNVEAAQGKVLKIIRTANELTYELDVEKVGLFVIADTWFPGWTAFINQKEVDILKVNSSWKGIVVSDKDTKLKLVYKK